MTEFCVMGKMQKKVMNGSGKKYFGNMLPE